MKKKILIIEDSVLSRTFMKDYLKDKDIDIEEAVNGVDGLDKIDKFHPDLVFLDLLMPELDGFGVLERLKEQKIQIPVVVLTADIQETTRKRCFDLDVKYFLNKPINRDKFLLIIDLLIGA